MATNTYIALSTITLTASDSEVVFTNIPSNYRDLVVVFKGNTVATSGFINLYFNNDKVDTNYRTVYAYADSSGAASTTYSASTSLSNLGSFVWWARAEPGLAVVNVMDYSATDKHKTSLVRFDNKGMNMTMMKARSWLGLGSITSLYLTATATSFSAGSTFSLYGIKG